MTDYADAARLWEAIEKQLLRKGMLRDGRDLREQRAAMVRVVGDALNPITPDTSYPERTFVDTVRKEMAARKRARQVRDFTKTVERLPAVEGVKPATLESAIKARLDAYLERSIYGSKGYDEDDGVEYHRRGD